LPREEVDALVSAGKTMIGREAGTIAAFLEPPPTTPQVVGRR